MREVVQLPGALCHVPFELGLVSAQLGFGAGDLSAIVLKDSASASISADSAAGCAAPRFPAACSLVAAVNRRTGTLMLMTNSTDTMSTTPNTAMSVLVSVCSATQRKSRLEKLRPSARAARAPAGTAALRR